MVKNCPYPFIFVQSSIKLENTDTRVIFPYSLSRFFLKRHIKKERYWRDENIAKKNPKKM